MMLSSINFTVIPFLLEALISVKDVAEWSSGPVYVFQLNKTIIIFEKHPEVEDITAMINCRPRISSENKNYLLCHAYEIIVSKITRQMYKENIKRNKIGNVTSFIPYAVSEKIPDEFFEIQLGKQGVKADAIHMHRYDSLTDAIELFHIDCTDLSVAAGDSMKDYENMKNGSHIISSFLQYEEDTTRALRCHTSWIITYSPSSEYSKNGKIEIGKNKPKFNFYLKLLPISYTNPIGKTFLIERNRMTCLRHPGYLLIFNDIWKVPNMIQYFNKMEIRDEEPKFTSYTHFEGNVSIINRLYHFSEDVHLSLLYIQPARNRNNYNKFYYDITK